MVRTLTDLLRLGPSGGRGDTEEVPSRPVVGLLHKSLAHDSRFHDSLRDIVLAGPPGPTPGAIVRFDYRPLEDYTVSPVRSGD